MATVVEKKKKTVRINGCVAAAQAAKYADVDVITAYPIRPYTATMMALAQMVANGELDAEYIVADSEHSQLSIAHGASSSGARVFTGSSQSLVIWDTKNPSWQTICGSRTRGSSP